MLLVIVSTQPSRVKGFENLLRCLAAQEFPGMFALHVVYDGFAAMPEPSLVMSALTARGVLVTGEAIPTGPSGTARRLLAVTQHPEADTVAVVDDDIVYPPDYLSRGYLALLDMPGDVATVTFHGKVWKSADFGNFARVSFDEDCPLLWELDTPGAGVSFSRAQFVRDLVRRSDFADFAFACDLLFGMEAWQQGLRLVALPHKAGWLHNFRQYDDAVWVTMHRFQKKVFARMVAQGWRGLCQSKTT